jgi:uncharacterized repeat protein (TIGR03803 family)
VNSPGFVSRTPDVTHKVGMSKINAFALFALSLTLSTPAYAGRFTTLYHFTDKADGGNPVGGVAEDSAGTTLYGETYQGGSFTCPNPPYNTQGCGTVYSVSKAGGFKVLASFNGANGAHGNIAPVLGGNTLFGATAQGGASNDGVVFSLNTDGTSYTVLHQFSGADGSEPLALVVAPSGILYGIAEFGGTSDVGVLFSLTQAGVYTVLQNFTLPVSGYPNTLIVASNGTLVGSSIGGGAASSACHSGCGTVFSYVPATGSFSTLLTFPGDGFEGYQPYVGSFGPGPTIYGADQISIFSLNRQAGFAQLADLNVYTVGAGAVSGPAYTPSGILYGVLQGSITANAGLIYSLKGGAITDLFVFDGAYGRNGSTPIATPMVTRSGSLIGTASANGNCTYCGTIWQYTP